MIGDAFEDLAQAILFDVKAKPLFQHFGGLFEDDYLEAGADAVNIRRGAVGGQGGLADNQNVISRKIGGGIDLLERHARVAQQLGSLAWWVEERDFARDL